MILAASVALTGCGLAEPRTCTGIGTPVGVGVTVEPPLAAEAREVAMEVCWDGACRKPRLELFPDTRAGQQTCAGDTCSVTAVPLASKSGFGDVAGLPKRPVEVRLTLYGARREKLLDTTAQVTPKGRFPNGPGCGEGGPNARILVQGTGTIRPLD